MRIHRGQLLLALAAMVWLAGCASIGPPLPPSLELPHPPSDLKAVRKGSRVTLTWTVPSLTTDRQSVRSLGKTRICRSVDSLLNACSVPVGEVMPAADQATQKSSAEKSSAKKRIKATFTQTLPVELQEDSSSATATYAVEVLNRADRGAGLSNQVHVPLAPALPAPEDFTAEVTALGVVVAWTAARVTGSPADSVRRVYRIYRRAEGSQQKMVVAENTTEDRDNSPVSRPSIIDQSFEWEKTYFYHADTLTSISRKGMPDVLIEGDDTPEVKVFTHDVFPPATPSGVEAVFFSTGQKRFIDLIWTPVTDADLAGYNVYRGEEGSAAVRLNLKPVKIPAFRDDQVTSGRKYSYAISAVDVRGNESRRSEEAGESVP